MKSSISAKYCSVAGATNRARNLVCLPCRVLCSVAKATNRARNLVCLPCRVLCSVAKATNTVIGQEI